MEPAEETTRAFDNVHRLIVGVGVAALTGLVILIYLAVS